MKILAGALALLLVCLTACRSAEPMDEAAAAPEVRYYVIADT